MKIEKIKGNLLLRINRLLITLMLMIPKISKLRSQPQIHITVKIQILQIATLNYHTPGKVLDRAFITPLLIYPKLIILRHTPPFIQSQKPYSGLRLNIYIAAAYRLTKRNLFLSLPCRPPSKRLFLL